jgi:hypothetical protein
MTIGAQIIGALDVDRTQGCQQVLGTHLVKARALAARTGNFWCELRRPTQQLLQHLRAQLMGRGAGGHLDRFQIEMATLAQASEDDFQQRGYFPRRLARDCFGGFFSYGDNESSTGRARQILSFTSSSS